MEPSSASQQHIYGLEKIMFIAASEDALAKYAMWTRKRNLFMI
jgi:hypothetical protein